MSSDSQNLAAQQDLLLLDALDRSPEVNQRALARDTRMALGLVNSCLRRLGRKGLIKVQQAPSRRYLYYLTPKGMAEKTRLTYEYIRASVDFYARARRQCRLVMEELTRRGARRVAFLGKSELAEIAYLTMLEFPLELAMIADGQAAGEPFFQWRVEPLEALAPPRAGCDALLYTRLEPPDRQGALRALEFEEIFQRPL